MPQIDQLFQQHNIKHYNWVSLERPISLEFYKAWLDEGMHGDMSYMKEHLACKQNPELLMKDACSAIVFLTPYTPHPYNNNELRLSHSHISIYAKSAEDYHIHLQQKVNQLCQELKDQYPDEEFLGFTDSKPVLERDLAYKAGLGWFAKNSCILNKFGSYFFIAEIYTTKKITATPTLHPNHCGTCTRCIDACPTQAIVKDKVVDARKCISYLTIESKSIPPVEIREAMGSWLFGCDICQSVCPWNQKNFGNTDQNLELVKYEEDLRWILSSSNKELIRSLKVTALSRTAGWKLKRNAIIVATNLKMKTLIPEIKLYSEHEKLAELVDWSLKKLL